MPLPRSPRAALFCPTASGLAAALLFALTAGMSPVQAAAARAGGAATAGGAGVLSALPTPPDPSAVALADAQKRFRQGDYEGALAAAEKGTTDDIFNEEWWRLRAESLMQLGRYEEARAQLARALSYNPTGVRLRLLAREAARFTNREDEAKNQLQSVTTLITSRRTGATPPEYLAALGEAALAIGAEPKLVLENFLRPAIRGNPPQRDAVRAAGQLALDKHDFALAARTFTDGLKLFTGDPDLLGGLAAAFKGSGEGEQFLSYAAQALEANPRHAPTRLLLADHLIDTEQYPLAREMLKKILEVNALQPEALALLAAIEEFENHPAEAAAAREKALSTWRNNPAVDHILGAKLSQHYRFKDGAAAQRRALAMDDAFTPARIQLAQDLLRLGQVDEGWELVARAHKEDGYDVEAFNLVTLHDHLGEYTAVEDEHFIIRMAKSEAPVYGQRALALLNRARVRLTEKYGIELPQKTTVEIYAEPGDFAVRTFGVPGVGGFLGVCFGSVITVNSPASSSANWEAVLWHEFTHVVTLTMTNNRMPRWLSEGISVYEETQANPAWAQLMSLNYRDLIIEGKMKPVSNMSAAFLTADDSREVGFAYFQSSLIVKFLVEKYGFDKLKELLRTLADGTHINDALRRQLAPLDQLDDAFALYARDTAKKLGGDLDLTRPDPDAGPLTAALAALSAKNFYTRLGEIRELAQKEDWAAAKAKLLELTAGGLYLPGAENPHHLLAQVAFKLNDTATERAALTTIAEHEGDAVEPVIRLLALANDAKDEAGIRRWADAWLAINPLAAAPWRALLGVHERAATPTAAIEDARVLLHLDPPDLPNIHYRLARQLLAANDLTGARRHVLQALEDAPRFRAAYELLAKLPAVPEAAAAPPATTTP